MITLTDLEYLEQSIRDHYDLDVNYNLKTLLEERPEFLKYMPFNKIQFRDEYIKILLVWRQIYHLVQSLNNEKKKGTIHVAIPVRLQEHSTYMVTQ